MWFWVKYQRVGLVQEFLQKLKSLKINQSLGLKTTSTKRVIHNLSLIYSLEYKYLIKLVKQTNLKMTEHCEIATCCFG